MFSLSKTQATLSNFNPRRELHGDEKEAAGDIKFECNLASELLAMFSPTLRSCLYHKDGNGGDLADQAHDAPNLRFPLMHPFKWELEIVGAELTIGHGIGGDSDIVLFGSVNGFVLAPQEGGTVLVRFRVQCHPDERAAGKLCMLQGESVEISVVPLAPLPDSGNE